MRKIRRLVVLHKTMHKKFIWGIGVALCVTPFFSSVQAQGSNETRLLLEMQTLRQEIAQLRDMVERQQYQLRKLQRQQANNAQTALNRNAIPGLPAASNIETVQGLDSSSETTEQLASVVEGRADSSPENEAEASVDVSNRNDTQAANTLANEANSANGTQSQTANQVEPAVVDVPAPVVESRDDYPPVIERSIGVPNTDVDANEELNAVQSKPESADNPAAGVIPNPIDSRIAAEVDNNTASIPAEDSSSASAVVNADTNQGWISGESVAAAVNKPEQQTGVIAVPNDISPAQPVPDVSETPIPAAIPELEYYQQGFELLKKSEHKQAVSVFKQQIGDYPQGDLADDAYYWIAESMYVNRDLDKSKENFKAIIQNYPQSPRLPDAMLKTAYIEQEQGNLIEARILLQEIVQFHPRSNAAISAKNRLAEIK